MRILPLVFLTTLLSCSSMRKWGIRSATPVFEEASSLNLGERNWDFFAKSSPSNLKLTELLYLEDKDNLRMLGILIKGYAGYAFAVPETLYLDAKLSGKEGDEHKRDAIDFYTRAFDYGVQYFGKKKIKVSDLLTLPEDKLKKKLKSELDEDDLLAILYLAQSWGSLINLQKENITLVSQAPRVKILGDYGCSLKPDAEHGFCDLFAAQYDASRPKMLGGNPERARETYAKAFAKYPKNLLFRVSYLEQLIVPAMDEEAFALQEKILTSEIQDWESLNRDEMRDQSSFGNSREINLFNAIAKKRLQIILKHKSKIF
jgi:hypothetical protein